MSFATLLHRRLAQAQEAAKAYEVNDADAEGLENGAAEAPVESIVPPGTDGTAFHNDLLQAFKEVSKQSPGMDTSEVTLGDVMSALESLRGRRIAASQ